MKILIPGFITVFFYWLPKGSKITRSLGSGVDPNLLRLVSSLTRGYLLEKLPVTGKAHVDCPQRERQAHQQENLMGVWYMLSRNGRRCLR